jgi:hypothetical protein
VRSGLQKVRGCAWLRNQTESNVKPVWVKGKTIAFHCPKSIITPRSLSLIELFVVWKRCGGDLWSMDVKSAEALLLLEEESQKRNENEENKL